MPPQPVLYDPHAGPLVTAFRVAGTVVPGVLEHPGIFLGMALNVSVFILYNLGFLRSERWEMDENKIKVLTGITTFFAVFYTNACYNRFQRFWSLHKNMCSAMCEVVLTIQVGTRATGKPYSRLAARQMVVSHAASLSRLPTIWGILCDLELCTMDESERLARLSQSKRTFVMCNSVAELAKQGMEESKVNFGLFRSLLTSLLSYVSQAEEVEELKSFPIPYEYFHLLNLMITISLGISAFSGGLSTSLWSPVFFFVHSLIVLGMLDLASSLADPFGDDDSDFPLHFWMRSLLENISAIVDIDNPSLSDQFKTDLDREAAKATRFHLSLEECERVIFGTADEDGGPVLAIPSRWQKLCCREFAAREDPGYQPGTVSPRPDYFKSSGGNGQSPPSSSRPYTPLVTVQSSA